MVRLGEMYDPGRGVPRDLRQAREWYARAATRGLARAREALARLGG
jgi:TPR repeat protein